MSQGHDPVAHFGSYSDYFFIDDGVLKVRVVSPLAWLSFPVLVSVTSGDLDDVPVTAVVPMVVLMLDVYPWYVSVVVTVQTPFRQLDDVVIW